MIVSNSDSKPFISYSQGSVMQKVRPADKVLQYLQTWFEEKRESRLPSLRHMAQQTQASVSSVYTVFRQLAKDGKIRTEQGRGSFLISFPGQRRTFRVALNIPFEITTQDQEDWASRIISGILSASTKQQPRIMVLPCATMSYDPEITRREILALRDEVDAMILFPHPTNEIIRSTCEETGKLVVDLNAPHDSATANFVSPDYLKASRKLGLAWRSAGRKRILLMSHVALEESVSSRQRLAGLISVFDSGFKDSLQWNVVVAEGARAADGAKAMRQILDSGHPLPDAIYCVADLQALGVLEVLRAAAINVPETISLVAGTGLEWIDPAHASLTRTHQPLRQMGETLIRIIAERLRIRGPVPGVYLPMEFVGGGTTTEAENRILEIAASKR